MIDTIVGVAKVESHDYIDVVNLYKHTGAKVTTILYRHMTSLLCGRRDWKAWFNCLNSCR